MHALETVIHTEELLVERLVVPGGWVYITTRWAEGEGEADAISTTFVPEKKI